MPLRTPVAFTKRVGVEANRILKVIDGVGSLWVRLRGGLVIRVESSAHLKPPARKNYWFALTQSLVSEQRAQIISIKVGGETSIRGFDRD